MHGWSEFIKSIEPSVRTGNVLTRMGVDSMVQFMDLEPEQILDQKGAGRKVLSEVQHKQEYFRKLGETKINPVEMLREEILHSINKTNFPPRLLLGLLEEIKFTLYTRL